MSVSKELLDLKKKIKNKRPKFIRQDYGLVKRVKKNWRKPKGVHSKMRHKIKSKRKMVSSGYRVPAATRGLVEGLKSVMVNNIGDLEGLDKEESGIIISSSTGSKKKVEIIKKATEMGIKILNLNGDEFIKKIEEKTAIKKEKKEKIKESKKKAKEKEDSKKTVAKEKKPGEDEEKEKKKQKDKVLTKKD
jgi:large subunit ribosomal protein L32e|tara:strand:- start:10284 stop:10853 length:570 start_codon:yes stop_codon:yes gene_type:complete